MNETNDNTRTYHGSCHCGLVRFEVDLDLSRGTGKCNCTICTKTRKWGAIVRPDAFRLLQGREHLSDYQRSPKMHDYFCPRCGVRPFGEGHLEEIGGDYVSVNLSTLDDLAPEVLAEAPVTYYDGRNDRWWEAPAETRHL